MTMDPSLTRAQTNAGPLPRADLSRRQSFKRSRSAPEDNELRPVVTAHFLDDYGAHHYHRDEDDDESTAAESDEEKQVGSPLDETRSVPSDEHDSESERGRSTLTREKSRRSRKSKSRDDPYLVSPPPPPLPSSSD